MDSDNKSTEEMIFVWRIDMNLGLVKIEVISSEETAEIQKARLDEEKIADTTESVSVNEKIADLQRQIDEIKSTIKI